jgi:hypothetical protein
MKTYNKLNQQKGKTMNKKDKKPETATETTTEKKPYKLNGQTQMLIDERDARKAELQRTEKRLEQARRELNQAKRNNHIPDIHRLEDEIEQLERSAKEQEWYLPDYDRRIGDLVKSQYHNQLSPSYEQAIRAAKGKAVEASRAYLDALAEIVILRRSRNSVACEMSKESPTGKQIPISVEGGLASMYAAFVYLAEEYAKENFDLWEPDAQMRYLEREAKKKFDKKREEAEERERLIKMAQRYYKFIDLDIDIAAIYAADQAKREVANMNNPYNVGTLPLDEVKFKADLQKGYELLREHMRIAEEDRRRREANARVEAMNK